ncbi:MAG: MarR family winged helix-turn-helix transcriptional regulator [Angustibacter sp.]
MTALEDADASELPVRTTYMLARLSRLVQRQLEHRLAPLRLSVPEFTTLSVLVRRPGLSNAQLARRAGITPQSMQDVLRGLEERRLVRRSADPSNRRILQTRLTPPGRRLTLRAEAVAADVEAVMLGDLAARRHDELRRTLRHCVAMLGGGLDRI